MAKKNGGVHICGDFKVTVIPSLDVDKYPLPKVDDILSNLLQGQEFSKIDLRQAYLQLECDEASKEILTLNTHK